MPYRPEQMFDLVEAVEQYPQFLPWCSGSTVSHRDPLLTKATIHVSFRGIRQSFSTVNSKHYPDSMRLGLADGPFKSLDGEWRFTALGDAGCRVDFRLGYEFSNALLARVAGPVFAHIAGTMMDAFLRRADQIYGASR